MARITRRDWMAATLAATAPSAGWSQRSDNLEKMHAMNSRVLARPVAPEPVVIQSIELLRNRDQYLVRVRAKNGLESVTVPHPKIALAPAVLLKQIAPVFLGQDARRLEDLLWDAYRHQSNYKLQGLLFWISVAALETPLLDLLGQAAGKTFSQLFGGAFRNDIQVYAASGNRGNRPEDEVEHLRQLRQDYGVKALKLRVGGRMSRDADDPPGRSEALIRLAREAFGDDLTLYADANSSYRAGSAIRIGRLLEEHRYGFYEEPCPFDDLWATQEVTRALTIPIAGGEQEFSLHRWRWMIENGAVDIVQPDLHYGGGFIRATKVARMANVLGLKVVPHMSGGGLGYVDVLHFAGFTGNIGPFMEFKGNANIPVECATSSLRCENGIVRRPMGIGYGVTVAPDFVRAAKPVTLS